MIINTAIHRIFVGLVLAGAGASLLGWAPQRAMAASATASASAIVLQGATVSTVTVLDVTPTPTPTTATTTVIQSLGSTRDVGVATGSTAANTSSSAFSSSSSRSGGAPTLSQTVTSGPAVISISGQPNQAISISLPNESVVIANGSQVAVTGFTHDAGLTPTIDASGTGTFNVTAAAAESQAEGSNGASPAGNGAGATGQVPFGQLVVATASPTFDVVISYN